MPFGQPSASACAASYVLSRLARPHLHTTAPARTTATPGRRSRPPVNRLAHPGEQPGWRPIPDRVPGQDIPAASCLWRRTSPRDLSEPLDSRPTLPPRSGHPASRPPLNRVSAFSPANKAPTLSSGEHPVQGPPGRGPVIPCNHPHAPAFPPKPAERGFRLKSVAWGLPGSLGRSPGPVRAVRRFLGKPAGPAPAGAGGRTVGLRWTLRPVAAPGRGRPVYQAGRFGRPASIVARLPRHLPTRTAVTSRFVAVYASPRRNMQYPPCFGVSSLCPAQLRLESSPWLEFLDCFNLSHVRPRT